MLTITIIYLVRKHVLKVTDPIRFRVPIIGKQVSF